MHYTNISSLSINKITHQNVVGEYCNGLIVGRIINLNEMSGLVESHRYSDVFYSIEDSGNENTVYAISKNGTILGNKNVILLWSVDFITIRSLKNIKHNSFIVFS